ncbi:hypothetical protein F383_33035 [Gossypium arboreum]|nr:hypothetical protein F383_13755 [Gossypium arboreum]KHG26800.1 hypothetical protein F383_33035 [Gossypium arboreum]
MLRLNLGLGPAG